MTPKTPQQIKKETPQDKIRKWKRGMERMCMIEQRRRIKELKDDLRDMIREYQAMKGKGIKKG